MTSSEIQANCYHACVRSSVLEEMCIFGLVLHTLEMFREMSNANDGRR